MTVGRGTAPDVWMEIAFVFDRKKWGAENEMGMCKENGMLFNL